MANSANVIGQFTDELEQASGEVAEEVKEAGLEMLEQGIQSVKGTPPPTPQQIQQKQQEDQKQLAKARSDLKWFQTIAANEKKLMEERKQQKLQKQQLEQQEEQNKKIALEEEKRKRIISPAKKVPMMPGQPVPEIEELARSRQEIGKGHGIGG